MFLKAGADLELGASTPLMEASQEGHLELVRYLLEARADVNATTGERTRRRVAQMY
jgi:ankyrin repeat domain-containing protein 17